MFYSKPRKSKSKYTFKRTRGKSMLSVYKNGKLFGSYLPSAHWFQPFSLSGNERTFRTKKSFTSFFS